MVFALSLAVLCTVSPLRAAAQDQAPAAPEAAAEDVGSIDAIMAAVYDVISGPAGPRDWDRMRSLFVPGARLMVVSPNAPNGIAVLSLEDYIARSGAFFMENGFFETELARKTDRYGGLAHAFSTYAAFRAEDDAEPFMRGINSFQLLFDGNRWWLTTIYWQRESPELPIPAEYLPE
jgi:hypothetical protein